MTHDNLRASDAFKVVSKRPLLSGEANVLVEVIRSGKVISRREEHNLVVNTGKADMASRLVVSPSKLFRYMRLGKNNTAPVSGQTTITTIVTGSNRTCDSAAMSGTRSAKFVRTWLTTDFSSSGICEAGLFDQITNGLGVMLARVVFTSVNKTASDTLKITWTVKLS